MGQPHLDNPSGSRLCQVDNLNNGRSGGGNVPLIKFYDNFFLYFVFTVGTV